MYVNISVYIFCIGPIWAGFSFFYWQKHEHLWKKIKLHNVPVCKLRTPSYANYEHFHVYLAYRRQAGTVVTRQTYDRAPRLTRPPTAHISRGEYTEMRYIANTLHVCECFMLFQLLMHRFVKTFSRCVQIDVHIVIYPVTPFTWNGILFLSHGMTYVFCTFIIALFTNRLHLFTRDI